MATYVRPAVERPRREKGSAGAHIAQEAKRALVAESLAELSVSQREAVRDVFAGAMHAGGDAFVQRW